MNAILWGSVALLVAWSPVWAQSTAQREQERQAKQAGERHPGSKPAPKSAPAAIRSGDKKTQAPRSKPGEAAVSTGGSSKR